MATKKADAKVVIIGDSGVGKTAIMQRFVENTFAKTQQTLGVSFIVKEHRGVHLAIWDTAGQEHFAPLSGFYCRDASAALICYDITDSSTFQNLDRHVKLLESAKANCCVLLVGCKYDLVDEGLSSAQVTAESARAYAQKHGIKKFIETSAKTNYNIDSVFDFICEQLMPDKATPASPRQSVSSRPPPVALNTAAPPTEKKCCD